MAKLIYDVVPKFLLVQQSELMIKFITSLAKKKLNKQNLMKNRFFKINLPIANLLILILKIKSNYGHNVFVWPNDNLLHNEQLYH